MTGKDSEKLYTVVEKTIRIDESAEIRSAYRMLRYSGEMQVSVQDLILNILEEIAIRRDEAWSRVAHAFGFESIEELVEAEKTIVINYVTKEFQLRSK